MTQLSKEKIIEAYRDLVRRKGSQIGEGVFTKETGLSPYYWKGKYWPRWRALQTDAGYEPNKPNARIDDIYVLRRYVELAQEIGRVPTQGDLQFKRRSDPSFPNRSLFTRWGNTAALLERAGEFCESNPELVDAVELFRGRASASVESRFSSLGVKGFVYLLRSGKSFKLGRSNAAGRRLRELAIQLPQKPDTIHVIETDDPEGIEAYWHRRFEDKRQGGEWFLLSKEDVAAFKRRRFQ